MKKSLLVLLLILPLASVYSESIRIALSPLNYTIDTSLGDPLTTAVLDTEKLYIDGTDQYDYIEIERIDENTSLDNLCRENNFHYVVFGTLNSSKDNYILNLSLYDYKEHRTTLNFSVGVQGVMQIFSQTDLLISRLFSEMDYFDIADVTAAELYGEGDGSLENPFRIYSLSDLVNISSLPEYHFRLMNDLDLKDINWVPLAPLSGSLDGGGYTLSNLSIHNQKTQHTGFFSGINESGRVQNLIIKDAVVEARESGGILCSFNRGTISNCEIIQGHIEGEYKTGGLCGDNSGIIEECFSEVFILGHMLDIGGFAGFNSGKIYRSGGRSVVVNDGITNLEKPDDYIEISGDFFGSSTGGFLGACLDGSVVEQCFVYSKVETPEKYGLVNGVFCGYTQNASFIDCYSVGTLSSGGNVGGFAGGGSSSSIKNSFTVSQLSQGINATGLFMAAIWSKDGGESRLEDSLVLTSQFYDVVENNWEKNLVKVVVVRSEKRFIDQGKRPYRSWDFENIWKMTERGPILRAVPHAGEQDPLVYWAE